ncbi:GNAT family N-acetyltransferase [Virgibacillus halodenitrificans]|uniref:aminoglycoside 6'-N-acetyltransferase n=1 Tax=Virgibacillus halodenitrificans TaxID=1482 RepID=UPI00136A3811|nr:aminoglycoside 6'-N-acetyltransferase [Virgibacillus halodenitrificans]MCJ0930536.1 GNAT family N-acetyltransferase [Virgibacillus halodenitrificans]MYL56275.1 GNAT family N-acetyltransferase [Virgibacillus halodenitrificans]WHX28105.1 GNAT family N-acetyltransferase [Virgibacillus halodenitrificans]
MLKEATLQEAKKVANLALHLWSNHTLEELTQEITHLISQPDSKIFLSYYANEIIGFVQCQLRYDYVEGTSSSPVGYLEGLFVKEEFRKQGVARSLVNICEEWAKKKGCREFASDCELENVESLVMHLKLGFGETNRIICFKKDL